MSEPSVSPAPKKGMSTGAKIAIGCVLGLVLAVGGCFVVSAYFLKKGVDKVKDFAEKAEKDPDYAAYQAALWAFQTNPEFDVVSTDETTKTFTVREKKTGKEVTFNLDDIKSGRLSIEAGGETVNLDVEGTAEGGGTLTIASDKGKMVLGGGNGGAVPDWIPSYPGARADSYSNLEVAGERSGTFTIHTSASVAEVLAFFEENLKSAGFEVRKATMNIEGAESANLTGTSGGRTVNVTVTSQEGETQGLVAYSEKQ